MKVKVISLPYIFQVLYVLYLTNIKISGERLQDQWSSDLETITASDLKISRSNYIFEYIKVCVSIEGQGHFLTLTQGRVHTKNQTGFSQKQLCRSEQKIL